MPAAAALVPFVPFGPVHLAMLAAVPALAVGLWRAVRTWPRLDLPVRWGLAALLATNEIGYLAYASHHGWIVPPRGLPLELCDVALWLAVAALLGARVPVGELLWFIALTGTTQALLTPDLGGPFPSYPGVKFFVGHGGTVAAALLLALAGRLRVRRGAWWRALLAVNAWAAALLALDLAAGTNYMYLRAPPSVPTLLDRLGPWPWYLLCCEVLAAGAFLLLELPVRGRAPPPPPGGQGGAAPSRPPLARGSPGSRRSDPLARRQAAADAALAAPAALEPLDGLQLLGQELPGAQPEQGGQGEQGQAVEHAEHDGALKHL